MNGNGLSETQKLSGDISQYLFDEWCQSYGDFTFGGQKYRAACDEEFEALGYGSDDVSTLVVIRESDGKAFEVELEANVYPLREVIQRHQRATS